MDRTDTGIPSPMSIADTLLDRTVLLGYSRPGYLIRRRAWHADDPVPDALAGKTAVVTGANSGLGQATAAGLALLGAHVVMVVRDTTRGDNARSRVAEQVPGADPFLERCDISDLDDVAALAGRLRQTQSAIDVLVHNAGVLPGERSETAQGHEITLATHVLGPLLLTELLRPALTASPDPRVVYVSSGGMYTQPLTADDPEYRGGTYRGATAYARTKRVQVAFAPVLARRYAGDGVGVHAMHPGWADTPGISSSLPGFHRLTAPLLRSSAEGADTTCWLAATRPAPPSGLFWHDRRPRPTHYLPGRGDDPQALQQMWDYCASAAGLDG